MKVPSFDLHTEDNISKRKKYQKNLLVFGLLNLIWFIFRTGSKPRRIVYPCQQEALKNVSVSLGVIIPMFSLTVIWMKVKTWFSYSKAIVIIILTVSTAVTGVMLNSALSSREVTLDILPRASESESASNIFVVNGPEVAHVTDLINLMGSQNFTFYQSTTSATNQGPDGLITTTDVVLLKTNCQWSQRGGTNTDFLKELIQAIIDHPDGFDGEIIVADNGQGRGSMNYDKTNSEDKKQSAQEVADSFVLTYDVSTFLWDNIRGNEVQEYSDGDMEDGYIVYDDEDPETEIYVSYPKFETDFGTKVSFKHGIWNGAEFTSNLKVINLPVLKSHSGYGVTATLKNYMGVQSEALANGHDKVATGGMATLMVECGLPTLNIIDAIWINANPESSVSEGPGTSYSMATRVDILIAGVDPVALDYWSAKNILLQTSELIGHIDLYSLDPDSSDSRGLTEAFGTWLNKSKDELVRAGYNVTSDELNMNVYVDNLTLDYELGQGIRQWVWIGSFGATSITLIVGVLVFIRILKQRKIYK
ncbi:MAG: DUF362 domain-containing protein [Candidatus Heimdallarchaeaceae archaeon]|jgi:uncharacterized protein (DUF362 family)